MHVGIMHPPSVHQRSRDLLKKENNNNNTLPTMPPHSLLKSSPPQSSPRKPSLRRPASFQLSIKRSATPSPASSPEPLTPLPEQHDWITLAQDPENLEITFTLSPTALPDLVPDDVESSSGADESAQTMHMSSSSSLSQRFSQTLGLEPLPLYACTGCKKNFHSASDWKSHEASSHHGKPFELDCLYGACTHSSCGQRQDSICDDEHSTGKVNPQFIKIIQSIVSTEFENVGYPGRNLAWGCGFCAKLGTGLDSRFAHIAKHYERGKTRRDWKFSKVIYALLRQPLIAQAWHDLMTDRFGPNTLDWPLFSWQHLLNTNREASTQLELSLEYYGHFEHAAEALAHRAFAMSMRHFKKPKPKAKRAPQPVAMIKPTRSSSYYSNSHMSLSNRDVPPVPLSLVPGMPPPLRKLPRASSFYSNSDFSLDFDDLDEPELPPLPELPELPQIPVSSPLLGERDSFFAPRTKELDIYLQNTLPEPVMLPNSPKHLQTQFQGAANVDAFVDAASPELFQDFEFGSTCLSMQIDQILSDYLTTESEASFPAWI